ncbi:hypothetical protein KKJ06_16645 [Xenorhabdus bovienii]|uniref:hypothetical protein n=1 Tax=Xenorhabdus bovienii TaxID=40576 RepID=UPI0023B327A1|nr:hypothetical protein [Xenorhabdus bovienii]MDE9557009.1 hypothetical protein [Xenorhabdus bovienii]
MPKPHVHSDLMMEYAKLAQVTDTPHREYQSRLVGDDEWIDCLDPLTFDFDVEYRRKPRTIRIGDIDVPEPVRSSLETGQEYYIPVLNDYIITPLFQRCIWDFGNQHFYLLEFGLIHLDSESAKLHAKALISLTERKGKNEII